MQKILLSIVFSLLSFSALAINQDTTFSRFHPVIAEQGMVVSQDNLATDVGVNILQQGGNAVDAAVATTFALSVTHQQGGGLGGGGFMLIYLAKEKKVLAINYRETAPLAATQNIFINAQGEVDRQAISMSHRAAGVPGTVAGLVYAQQQYGKLSLETVMKPAIELAKNGFIINPQFADLLKERQAQIVKWPASKAVYMPNGKLLQAGDKLVQKDLANTLTLIAKHGAKAFYTGKIAQLLVADMQKHDGFITKKDLASYSIQELTPLAGEYQDYKIMTMPLPSAGGVALLQMLTLLEPYPLAEWGLNSSQTMQVMSQAMNLAFADRNYLGDSNFVNSPVKQLLDTEYLNERRKLIDPSKAVASEEIKPGLHAVKLNNMLESPQTSHMSVIDKDRNMVANTFTINYSLGTAIVVPGTGIVLNNEMDDFAAEINAANAYGLVGSAANLIAPGKRPVSSMTPTLIFDAKGNPVMTTGAIGGSRIITIVLQNILNTLEHERDIATATNAPRFHSQWLPNELSIEEGFSEDTLLKLQQQSNNVQLRPRVGAGHSIVIQDNTLYGAADPRISTSKAAGY